MFIFFLPPKKETTLEIDLISGPWATKPPTPRRKSSASTWSSLASKHIVSSSRRFVVSPGPSFLWFVWPPKRSCFFCIWQISQFHLFTLCPKQTVDACRHLASSLVILAFPKPLWLESSSNHRPCDFFQWAKGQWFRKLRNELDGWERWNYIPEYRNIIQYLYHPDNFKDLEMFIFTMK